MQLVNELSIFNRELLLVVLSEKLSTPLVIVGLYLVKNVQFPYSSTMFKKIVDQIICMAKTLFFVFVSNYNLLLLKP